MTASADIPSHPVGIECPACNHRFRIPIKGLSVGASITCHACLREILISARTIRQLLRQIDSDLSTPQDLQILLRPPDCLPPQDGPADEDSASGR